MRSLKTVPSTIRIFVCLRNSGLQQSTQDEVHRVLMNIEDVLGRVEKTKAADKLIPLIESGISEEDLLQVLEEMEADL